MDNCFWFSFGFDPAIKDFILSHKPEYPTLCCQRECQEWALILAQKYGTDSISLEEGMYFPQGYFEEGEGHTWLIVSGHIFDPTAGQFGNLDTIDEDFYQTHSSIDGEAIVKLVCLDY